MFQRILGTLKLFSVDMSHKLNLQNTKRHSMLDRILCECAMDV